MSEFVLLINDWYRLNARVLPWRDTKNPYFIWLSEVILQQTRVDQGLNYYERFVKNFTTITELANAQEEEVLKLWQGLGYYSRARNLHQTAKQIRDQYNGAFPKTYDELISLRGIGPYTAAAIASFAFDLPHAVVDGNVYRVLSRYFGIDEAIDSAKGKKTFQELADTLIPHENPADYNQAIMDFGATQCVPNNPNCADCTLNKHCASAFKPDLIKSRPVKKGKSKVRNRYFHYIHAEKNGTIALTQRTEKDVWAKLYEFPMIETVDKQVPESLLQHGVLKFTTKHILSHQHIHAFFYQVTADFDSHHFNFYPQEELEVLPIHRLMEKYLETIH